jgi:hypothetical protein
LVSAENITQAPIYFLGNHSKTFKVDDSGEDGDHSYDTGKRGRKQQVQKRALTITQDQLRSNLIQLISRNPERRINLDDAVYELNQPKEQIKRALQEMCTFENATKTYKAKEGLFH